MADTIIKTAFVISQWRLDQSWQPREILVRTAVTHSLFFSFFHKFFPGLCCFANEWLWNLLFFIFLVAQRELQSLWVLSPDVVDFASSSPLLCGVWRCRVHRQPFSKVDSILIWWGKDTNIKMMLLEHDTSINSLNLFSSIKQVKILYIRVCIIYNILTFLFRRINLTFVCI